MIKIDKIILETNLFTFNQTCLKVCKQLKVLIQDPLFKL